MRDPNSGHQPYLVSINITRQCNLNCGHCYLDAAQRDPGTDGQLSRATLERLLADLGRRAPGMIVVLSGGEPLLYDELEAVVAAGVQAGLRVVLGTNGVLLDERRIASLKDAGLGGVSISLDAVDASGHDAFRGVPGSFARSRAAFEACARHELHAQLNFSITRANVEQLEDIVELGRDLGAAVVNFFFLVCVGRGHPSMDLPPPQYETALSRIADLQQHARGIMVQARCAPHFKRILHTRDPASPLTRATGYDGGGCLAGTRYCRIDPHGEVTPCPYMEMSGGNIGDRPFWDIWDHAPLFARFREPALEGRCGTCEFAQLCGGCRARSVAQTGRLMGEDPNCAYIPAGGPVIEALEPGAANTVAWTDEASTRLERVPLFLRGLVRKRLEARALAEGIPVTVELMKRHREERERELGVRFR